MGLRGLFLGLVMRFFRLLPSQPAKPDTAADPPPADTVGVVVLTEYRKAKRRGRR